MSRSLKVMTIDDVTNDEELKRYFEFNRKLVNALSFYFAVAAGNIKAMLKDYDKKAGKRRRAKVARPLALAAGVLVLVSKFLALAAKRFNMEYGDEIAVARRTRTARARKFKFGP